MKKIFAFIGSPLKEKSNTAAFTRQILEKVREKAQMDISSEIVTAGDVEILSCRGCWGCMVKGQCPLDGKDDMAGLKKKMLEADFIIWGSPVYTMQVTGQMKTFLDRLTTWYHLLRLAGKPGMTVSTTGGSGQDELQQFLSMLMVHIGIKQVGSYNTIAYFPGMFADQSDVESKADQASGVICDYLSGRVKVETDEKLEEAFEHMKTKVAYGKDYLRGEYQYWHDNGYLECGSFGELLEKIK